ncbi:MAG: FKBP-type peptidyl-prolyl cis-trans isomerase [Bacteroidales bacterium]
MIRKAFSLIVLTALLPTMGCEDEIDHNALKAEEERYFNLYMNANYQDKSPLTSGLYFIEEKEGSGLSPDTGNFVLINYLAYTIPDETVVDTYTEKWAREYNLYNSGVLYGPYKYKHGSEAEGMKEGLSRMKEGGIARLIFKSDLGYGANGLGNIGKYASLMYDIELVKVIRDVEQWELDKINTFLAEHPNAFPIHDDETDVTMYYIPGVAGDSTHVKDGEIVEIFYTGSLLDGRVFDSNIGQKSGFRVTMGEEEVIRGWEIGLKWFRYGGTGQLLIPHQLGYGERGSFAGNTAKTSIPPYETLLFEIEVSKTSVDE